MVFNPLGPIDKELFVTADELEWEEKSLKGCYEKRLFTQPETGATISLIKFDKGAGIPVEHEHASNQFMYLLSGLYSYPNSNITMRPGDFYGNQLGHLHGPTIALEESVMVEIYDGPHYPSRPEFYDNDADAQ